MDYNWIKAIHVAAVLVWTGGLFVQTLAIVAICRGQNPAEFDRRAAAAVMSWDRKVTTPALLVVWAMGLWAALSAGWLAAHWLWIKLAIVLGLSALHRVQSGALRRIAAGGPITLADLSWRPLALLPAFAAVAILAVVKPSFE